MDTTAGVENLTETALTVSRPRFIYLVGSWLSTYDIITVIILLVVIVFGLGNIALIVTFLKCPRLRKPFNVLLIGIALADFTRSGITAPMEIAQLANGLASPFGESWCSGKIALRSFSFNSTLILLAVVSFVRMLYGVMTFPPKLTNRKSVAILFLTYILASALTLLSTNKSSGTFTSCMGKTALLEKDKNRSKTYGRALLSYCIAVFGIMVFSYSMLGIRLRFRRKNMVAAVTLNDRNSLVARKANKASKSEIMTLKVAVYVSVCFLTCYLIPFFPMFDAITDKVPFESVFHYIAIFNAFSYLQCCANPTICLWNCKIYRDCLISVIPQSAKNVLVRLRCLSRETQPAVIPMTVTSHDA